jgi:ornithine carbamoyltransferase
VVGQAPIRILEDFNTRKEGQQSMKHDDFLSIRDWSTEDLRALLAEAAAVKSNPSKYENRLKGKALAMIFEKPSLRTRVTFDVGIHQLGGYSIYLGPGEIKLGQREAVSDVAKNLERMVQGIMIRTFGHNQVVALAKYANIPVINGLTDFSHPCQGLADYMTVLEAKGSLEGVKIAYVGDGNNVAHSLIYGAVRFGSHLAVATPEGYEPNPEVIRWAQENSARTGSKLEILRDPALAVAGADVIYTDVWASMGQESESAIRKEMFRPYQVNDELLSGAKKDCVFMHCLPAHRGEEVTDSVIDSEQSIVFQQAENRLHAQKAVMLALMS